ncbi:endo beta 1,4 glucanase [Talaromyces proteolyticus]|uniref:cellulase n=1 Tax=Talaromyces proteolyticus TaxID=1131652 RepID=A0AAD4KU11_9EURO|nr:endo beta 1,4 glucanase [Talaromyces proteolyticus]KAH8700858.1 endo beta 1,4 glucanase [Talaromyces proteolyticus]
MIGFGANESGAEFGQTSIPGVEGTDYTFASTTAIQTLIDAGMNIFRVPFLMERMVPNSLTGSIDSAYFSGYSNVINYITSKGAYAVVDPHNFGRYNGNIISSTSDFGAFWKTVASQFSNNSKVIFDTNNEYHDMDESLVVSLNQAAIDAIRSTGATSQYIFAEGNSYTGAWTWASVNDDMKSLTDSSNKLIYEMHQYLDSDGSGTSATCVNSTIGQNRVEAATAWLKDNHKIGFLGEFAGGANSVCESAVTGMLDYLQQNSDVWLGASWWAAGPWWGDYIYSIEPPSGVAYESYMSVLKPYFP